MVPRHFVDRCGSLKDAISRCPTPSTDERINLIKSIFSNPDEVVALEYISRDDAQAFVDLIDEVSVRTLLPLKNGPVEPH